MCHAVLAVVSNCCPPLKGRFLTRYSPVRHCPLFPLDESSFHRFSFDLHVLSTPPAFVLSQDQTLYKSYQHGVSTELIFTELFVIASNFLPLPLPVIDLTRSRQASVAHLCAPVWCFSFRSLFNLQGTRPTRNSHYPITYLPYCQVIFSKICNIFFRNFSFYFRFYFRPGNSRQTGRFRPDGCKYLPIHAGDRGNRDRQNILRRRDSPSRRRST